ncbi:MAG: DNA-binding protein [Chlorobiaceae bacterium]|nr:DNA-binding protein [Chlorobiaceae bacterium]MBA4309816.1 DNA-binding protein [Chlorobiaceae bacterium]
MKKVVTVFGSSLPIEGEKEYQIAYELGKKLAKANLKICSGGNMGVMEAVSKGAVEVNGEAIGITLNHFSSNGNKYLSEEILCTTLFERVQKLIDYGDAFVILQGGTGTLLEFAAVWELLNKNFLKQKPAACFSEHWKKILDVMEEQIAKEKRKTELIKYFDDVEELADFIIRSI